MQAALFGIRFAATAMIRASRIQSCVKVLDEYFPICVSTASKDSNVQISRNHSTPFSLIPTQMLLSRDCVNQSQVAAGTRAV